MLGSLTGSRDDKVAALIRDVDAAMGLPTGAPNFDDKVGVAELRFTTDQLRRAEAGETIQQAIYINGDGGRYELVFEARNYQASGWSGVADNWRSLGGIFPVGAPVTAVARKPGQLDLFICGNDGRIYTSWWTEGQDWSGIADNWRPIGGFFPAGARVAAVARTPDSLDLFVIGNDGRVYTSWWFHGGDWSGINDNWRSHRRVLPGRRARVGGRAHRQQSRPLHHRQRRARLHVLVVRRASIGPASMTTGARSAASSRPERRWRRLRARRTTSTCSSPATMAGSTRPGGSTGSTGRASTITGARSAASSRSARRSAAVARTPDNLDLFICGNDGRVYTSWWFHGRRLVRDQRQLALAWRASSRPGHRVRCCPHAAQPRPIHYRQRRPGLHVVVVRRGRLVRDQRQLVALGGFFPPGRRSGRSREPGTTSTFSSPATTGGSIPPGGADKLLPSRSEPAYSRARPFQDRLRCH